MDVATHEGLKTLAVGELQIRHPAMPIDLREGIQFALIALVVESTEMAPVHLEAFAGIGLHAHERAPEMRPRAHLVDVVTQDGVAAVIAEGPQLRRAFVRMEPDAGERFEVDWGHFG